MPAVSRAKNVSNVGRFWLQERSRDGSSFAADDWDDRPRTIEEIQAMLQTRKDAALKRERALSYAFSHQVRHDFLFFSYTSSIISLRRC